MIKTGTNKQNTGSLPVSRVLKIGNKNLHINNIRCLFGYDHVGIEGPLTSLLVWLKSS